MSIIQGYIKKIVERIGFSIGWKWLKCNHFLSDINTGTKRYELHKKSLFQTIAGQFEEAGQKGEEKEKDGFTK